MNNGLVLITGASGFIGRVLCAHMLAEGYQVRALVRKTSSWSPPVHKNLQIVIGDMRDEASLEAATAGVSWVAHLAAVKSDEPDSDETNIGGAKNLINACRRQGVGFIVNISTQSANIRRKGTYARTKEAADRVFHDSGFPVTTLRSSLVYGDSSGGIFASLIKFSQLPIIPVIGPGKAPHWPIHLNDLVHIIEMAARLPSTRGRIYDVGGPDKIDMNQLFNEILKRKRISRTIVHVPLWMGMSLARLLSFLPHPPFTRSNILGSNEETAMDVGTFFRDFDFTPRPLKDGLDELFQREVIDKEAALLLSYAMSASGSRWKPGIEERERYVRAVAAQIQATDHALDPVIYSFPSLLGGLDVVSKFFYPRSILQQKLIVAAALAEYQAASAPWLLPQKRYPAGLFLELVRQGLRILAKCLLGLPFLLIPGFLRRNIGYV